MSAEPQRLLFGHAEQQAEAKPKCPSCNYIVQDDDKVGHRENELVEFGVVTESEISCPECDCWFEIELETEFYDAWILVDDDLAPLEMPACPDCGSTDTMHIGNAPDYLAGETGDPEKEATKCRDCGTRFDESGGGPK